jgi:hypothetical protein
MKEIPAAALSIAAGVLVPIAGLVGILSFADQIDVRKSVAKCASAYYSTKHPEHTGPEVFVRCMKSEFPNTFMNEALKFSKIEEFSQDKQQQ